MTEEVKKFMEHYQSKLCVLSTASKDGKPQSAVVMYLLASDGSMIISTHITSRKWQNLSQNSLASLTVGCSFTEKNVQIEGKAILVSSNDKEFGVYEKTFYTAYPHLAQYKGPDSGFVIIKPTWIRLTDFTSKPTKVEEYKE